MAKTGIVKFFNDEKGFGFITQDDGGPDLFCHRKNVAGGGLLEGDEVLYDEETDERSGKPKALNVSGGTGGESWGRSGGGGGGGGGGKSNGGKGKGGGFRDGGVRGAKSGVVKFFNEEKGFGFISQHDGSPDVFVHRREVVPGQALVEGDEVHFDDAMDDRSGKFKASNVSGGTRGDGSVGGQGGGGYGGGGGGYGGGRGGYGGGAGRSGKGGGVPEGGYGYFDRGSGGDRVAPPTGGRDW